MRTQLADRGRRTGGHDARPADGARRSSRSSSWRSTPTSCAISAATPFIPPRWKSFTSSVCWKTSSSGLIRSFASWRPDRRRRRHRSPTSPCAAHVPVHRAHAAMGLPDLPRGPRPAAIRPSASSWRRRPTDLIEEGGRMAGVSRRHAGRTRDSRRSRRRLRRPPLDRRARRRGCRPTTSARRSTCCGCACRGSPPIRRDPRPHRRRVDLRDARSRRLLAMRARHRQGRASRTSARQGWRRFASDVAASRRSCATASANFRTGTRSSC